MRILEMNNRISKVAKNVSEQKVFELSAVRVLEEAKTHASIISSKKTILNEIYDESKTCVSWQI